MLFIVTAKEITRYLLLHLPVAGCKQDTYSVSLLSKAFKSVKTNNLRGLGCCYLYSCTHNLTTDKLSSDISMTI